ncbi:plexin-B1 [Osmerus mordax]|uniref:plexin-B1 n=1 Tax=Osmerus mordax TaxID=8014 RepID=UPI00350F4291
MPPGMVCRLLAPAVRSLLPPLLLLVLGCPFPSGLSLASDPSHFDPYPSFSRNDTLFEHLALHPDPSVGRVYIGARDRLFQLDRFLAPELQDNTGPVTDSRECLPPVTVGNCPQARRTSNHNKLLLVDPFSMELITCGSVNQGICQKRSLASVDEVLFSAERPVDTQYVAANHPNVSTVGLIVRSRPDRQPVLFVGRGYTTSHPPISTRNLAQEPVFSYEETAKLAVAGRLSEYDHHFVASFAHRQHVYFLFYRRDLKSQSREYRTYVSRVCLDDQAYYSYVEVPLACRSAGGKSYNLLQAVRLGLPKNDVVSRGPEVLLGVFSTRMASSTRPSEDSALCMFYLDELDQRINSTRDLCYTQVGRTEEGNEAAYIEYDVKSNCANLPSNTLDAYPCGSDHTPSPMASRMPVEAESILDSPSARLTAVEVSVRARHTIAFLGDSKGNLHKVFLGPEGEVEVYDVVSIQPNAPISSDLLLDQAEENLFIMTSTMLQKRPVAECRQHLDCQSCLSAHDPYCGWCVLEGRCVQQGECGRGAQTGQWLWSFDMEQQCLIIQSLNPANISREEKRSISLSVPGLPVLEEGESYSCYFHSSSSPATITGSGVVCLSPDPHRAPAVSPGQDFVTVTLSLRFNDVVVTANEFTFYDCTSVKQLSGSMPCRGCVLSRWGCNWCVHQHSCTHKPTCEEGVIIYNEHFKLPTSAPPTVKTVTIATTVPTTTVAPTSTTPPTILPTITTTATIATTTIASTTTTEATMTVATTQEPSTTPLSTTLPTTTIPEPATSPLTTTIVTKAPTTLPPPTEATTSLVEIATTEKNKEETTSTVIFLAYEQTEMETEGLMVTPGNVDVATEADLTNVTLAADDDDLYELTPLVSPPELPPLEVVTDSPPSSVPEMDQAQSLGELPSETTQASSSGYSLPSPFPLGEPSDSEPTFHLDFTQPPQDPQPPTQDTSRGSDPEVLFWPGEDADEDSEVTVAENDTASFSAATVLSGDGEVDHTSQAFPRLMDADSELDYQYDMADTFLPGDEGSYVSWGSSACPCVEKVQGSALLPVKVEKKITLLARNLHLYQDRDLDYECVLVIEGRTVVVDAYVEMDDLSPSLFDITCQLHQYSYSAVVDEYNAMVYVKRRDTFHVDSAPDLYVTLYNCSVGRSDCSRCHTADAVYGCVWCGGAQASCLYGDSCSEPIEQTCPAPVIHSIEPLSGLVEGGTVVTISGSNLGQKADDILESVTVAGVACTVIPQLYEISSRIVCRTKASGGEKIGQVSVEVSGGEFGLSSQRFSYQDPFLMEVTPQRGPKAGGTSLTITGRNLLTGRPADLTVTVGGVPCSISSVQESSVVCVTGSSNRTSEHRVTLHYSNSHRHLHDMPYRYTPDPNITNAAPAKSFLGGGRLIFVSGHNLDVVQDPRMVVTVSPYQSLTRRRRSGGGEQEKVGGRRRRMVPEVDCPGDPACLLKQYVERCEVNSSSLVLCRSPAVVASVWGSQVAVDFLLDNLRFPFGAVSPQGFLYEPDPVLHPLNQHDPLQPYRYNPGSFIQLEGENLDLAISKDEVVVLVGEGVCAVKTLTRNHLYCEPPPLQPAPGGTGRKREGGDTLPEFTVQMGNLNFSLGRVQYDTLSLATFPLEAQVGVGVGASIVALIVLIIVLIYRRKSKQALRDYKKVQIQLENLETSVRDRCKKEFTDLMTEMMDMSSDLVGSGIPFLDYRAYAERIFFPGHRESPLRRGLDVQECRRQTVEQGLLQLSNLLNSKLFLTKFIHTLESQRTFSPRDRAYVASLLTVALHGKLEYFTDILKTLLNDLVEQYVAKNPKLMLRRTETVVEKLLTNWMSICLYAFLRDSAGESLYMLFRAIKHQVDKGPVDAVTGKAKYTLNDNRLLREDVEYRTLTLNVLMQGGGVNETQPLPSKVLDCDTITQVKEKLLEQVYKGTSFSHRPHTDSLDLEWRSGVAGHLILSDEDLTSVVQGNWKRLNTLQHYKVPDGATVALVPRHTKHIHHDSHDYVAGEKTPMLEDADEGGVRLWHLVKASEEPELPKHRRGSLRERERAKAIPEIYLTRLLSMKGTLQKFVDDLFTVILSTSRPVPLAVKYFFDLLDDQAGHHGISDPETIHIWKTNSLPLRFWINIVKNPQFIFDVQASDHVDAVLSVISQTFMDSCTLAEHKLGRDSPINKLLYARDIPRYKQMVERYYADIRQTISASDQEMNSALAELSRNYSGELNYLVALHELYKYINKYYDQIITALEEDTTAQKMQLGYRLQQIAAAVENKVTDL